ncbi:MAG TPA: hypothetical protein VFH54_05240 [Mycobacteriales bacterium]|nr:hypothetical protein [Mycobacteriales bacterium]
MDESTANQVVELLRARRIFASVNRRAGVYNVGVRVVIPDGREAIWDNDGAAGLEAMVLRDGVLVGFVPQIPDSDDLDAAKVADIIAAADYDAPPAPDPPSHPSAAPPAPPAPPAPSPAATQSPAASKRSGWRDRLRRRH